MALIFADGFDIYSNLTDVVKAGWYNESGNQTFHATDGRFGGGCLKNLSNSQGWYLPCAVAPGTTIILAFAYYPVSLAGGGANDPIIIGWDRAGSQLFALDQNTAGDLKAYDANDAQAGSTASAALADASWSWIEIKVTLGTTSGNGSIEVQVNGTTVIGPVSSLDTNTGRDCGYISLFGSNGDTRYDDVILMDSTGTGLAGFLGDTRIDTLIPNGDGSNTGWTASAGSDYQCVDDAIGVADDDTTYISSSTASQKTDLQMSNLADNPTGVHGIQVRTRCSKTDAGDRTYRAFIDSSGSVSNGATMGIPVGYCWRRNGSWSRDPNGSVVWNKNSINALNVGVEIIA